MTTAMSDIDISAPISAVYNQWTQFETFPTFMSGVVDVVQHDDDQLSWHVSVGGAERAFATRITEQVPDDRIAWKSIAGPEQAGVVTFHRLSDDETRVRLQIEWEPEGLTEHVGAMLQVDDAQVASDLREFKRLMEANGFETGGWRGTIDRPSDATGR